MNLCNDQYHDINTLIIFNNQHDTVSHGNYCLLLVPNHQPHLFVSFWLAKNAAEAENRPIL